MLDKKIVIVERIKFFIENYDVIARGAYHRGPKKFISDGDVRFCRFCRRGEGETTFENDSHAIPECLGNHQLILLDECDVCNKFFSEKLEDHLDKYTKPYRVAGQINGKRGIPNYRSQNKKSRIEFGEVPKIKTQVGEEFVCINHDNKTITIKLHQDPHIPLAVYKALVKIALSVIESKPELNAFSATIDWLLEPQMEISVIKPAILMYTFIPGPRPTTGVTISVFRRKQEIVDVPYALLVIEFGNVILQLVILSQIDNGRRITVSIPYYPSQFEFMRWPYGELTYGSLDLSEAEKVKREFPINYHFEEMIALEQVSEESLTVDQIERIVSIRSTLKFDVRFGAKSLARWAFNEEVIQHW